MADSIWAEMMRMRLAMPPEPPGWSNPAPGGCHSHYIPEGRTMPLCDLRMHYGGERYKHLPEGLQPCPECQEQLGEGKRS